MSQRASMRPQQNALEGLLNDILSGILQDFGITDGVSVTVDHDICAIEASQDSECEEQCSRLANLIQNLPPPGRRVERGGEEASRSQMLDEVRRAFEECARCSGGMLIYGVYICEERKIVLYPKCLRVEPCLDISYLASKLLETLAHELIHAGQYQGWTRIGTIPISVRMDCNETMENAANRFPYRYRPHEAEAFDKMAQLANSLRRTRAAGRLEGVLRDIVRRVGVTV